MVLQRGETRGPRALSIVLLVIFLEESVAPTVWTIYAVGSCCSAGTQPSVPRLHLQGSCLGRLESASRDASIFHRQFWVGMGVARDGVLRAHVVEVDEGSIADGLSIITGEDLLIESLRIKENR